MTLVSSIPTSCKVTAITGSDDTTALLSMVKANYIPALSARGINAQYIEIPGVSFYYMKREGAKNTVLHLPGGAGGIGIVDGP